MEGIIFATPENRLDAEAYTGSMQRTLALHQGEPVTMDFLIGTNTIMTKSGVLHNVGEKYVVIYNATNNSFVVGDIYNLKFATFPRGGNPRML